MIDRLTDLPPYHDIETQTEFIIEKPIPDLSMPVYHGIPKETQIYPDENLFDFDYEAEPLLQVLLTRTQETSRMEVLEEEELRSMKDRQEYLLEKKQKGLEDVRRLEDNERIATKMNIQRKGLHKDMKEKKMTVHKQIVSRVFSQEYLKFVAQDSLTIQNNQGLFIPEEESRIHAEMIPWLVDLTVDNIKSSGQCSSGVDNLIDHVDKTNLKINKDTVKTEMDRRAFEASETERLRIERDERRRSKLAWKLQRRENRRLYNLTNRINEQFVVNGQEGNDDVTYSLTDVDGLMDVDRKYAGLLGGFIGEVSQVVNNLFSPDFAKFIPEFEFSSDRLIDILRTCVESIVKSNHMVELGVREDFEAKMKEYDDGFEIANFNPNYINEQKDDASRQDVINIFKHYAGSDMLRTVFLKPEPLEVKTLEKVKVDGDNEAPDEQQKTGETQQMTANVKTLVFYNKFIVRAN